MPIKAVTLNCKPFVVVVLRRFVQGSLPPEYLNICVYCQYSDLAQVLRS